MVCVIYNIERTGSNGRACRILPSPIKEDVAISKMRLISGEYSISLAVSNVLFVRLIAHTHGGHVCIYFYIPLPTGYSSLGNQ